MQSLLSKYILVTAITGLLCLPLPRNALSADTPLTRAQKAFQTGSYEDALRLFESVTGPDRVDAAVGMSRIWMILGEYDRAETACRDLLSAFPDNERLISQLAEVLAETGRSEAALQMLKPIASRRNASVTTLVQTGKMLKSKGRSADADLYFERVLVYFDQGLIFEGIEYAAVAEAFRALERFHDANSLFREASQIDPANPGIHVLWGNLFLEKYNLAEARRSYEMALKQNARYVPALVGMARVAQGRAANEFLDAALKINRRSVAVLVTRAGMLITDDRYDAAEKILLEALETNPQSAEALTLLAAIAYMGGDHNNFQKIENKVETLGQNDGRFYTRIAEICGRNYRFEDAVQMARKAVNIDPHHWNGHTVLSMNLLRLGRETEARSHLEKGFEGDPFNVWAVNMLRVLDTLDGFETRRNEYFTVRMHPTDAQILWPYLEPLLAEAWNALTQKYDFKPRTPILIEIFTKHEDFAVRTSGLPEIGHLLGVCFGSVITLDSPRAHNPPGSINWQEVVWHEFAHVITLQMTDNRIPRWLSEGVSVFEEHKGRPEWGRRQDLDLIRAVQDNRIIGLKQLDEGFSQAKTLADLNFAYYQSSLLVAFMVEKYGFDSLKELIYRFGVNADLIANIESVFHVSLDTFETAFLAWLHQRVNTINVHVPGQTPPESGLLSETATRGRMPSPAQHPDASIDALRKQVEAHPRDFTAHFQLGLIYYRLKNYPVAIEHLTVASDLLPGYSASPGPRQILAEIYGQLGDNQAMIRELDALIKVNQHAFDACIKLGQVALANNQIERAVYYLERAIAVNPYDPTVHRSLGEIFMQKSDYTGAIREYSVLVAIDDTDPALANTDLAEAFLRDGKKPQAKSYALAALEIAPMFERAQDILLDALEP